MFNNVGFQIVTLSDNYVDGKATEQGIHLSYFTGFQDENSTKTSSTLNLAGADPWSMCVLGFLEKGHVLTHCPSAVSHSWPIVLSRLTALYTVIDPA